MRRDKTVGIKVIQEDCKKCDCTRLFASINGGIFICGTCKSPLVEEKIIMNRFEDIDFHGGEAKCPEYPCFVITNGKKYLATTHIEKYWVEHIKNSFISAVV